MDERVLHSFCIEITKQAAISGVVRGFRSFMSNAFRKGPLKTEAGHVLNPKSGFIRQAFTKAPPTPQQVALTKSKKRKGMITSITDRAILYPGIVGGGVVYGGLKNPSINMAGY